MKKFFIFLFILFFVLTSVNQAFAYHSYYDTGSSINGASRYRNQGSNIFYAYSSLNHWSPYKPRGHCAVRNALDYQVCVRNPNILAPRRSINNQRWVSGNSHLWYSQRASFAGSSGVIGGRQGFFY